MATSSSGTQSFGRSSTTRWQQRPQPAQEGKSEIGGMLLGRQVWLATAMIELGRLSPVPGSRLGQDDREADFGFVGLPLFHRREEEPVFRVATKVLAADHIETGRELGVDDPAASVDLELGFDLGNADRAEALMVDRDVIGLKFAIRVARG